jgi:hypothetical protein
MVSGRDSSDSTFRGSNTNTSVHELLHWPVLLGEYQGSIYSVESVYERNKCSGPSFPEKWGIGVDHERMAALISYCIWVHVDIPYEVNDIQCGIPIYERNLLIKPPHGSEHWRRRLERKIYISDRHIHRVYTMCFFNTKDKMKLTYPCHPNFAGAITS